MVKSIVALTAAAMLSAIALPSAQAWNMKPVTSIQARVQGDKPYWDKDNKAYVSSYFKTFKQQQQAVLDTVNTASVEGALKFVQSECINQKNLQKCERKNKVKYVVFYNITIANPNNTLAEYGEKTDVYPEYGPFVAMDFGACTKTGDVIPPECDQYNGLNGQPNLGSFVGGVPRTDDVRAPYKDTIWFSYPNSCVQQPWANKTDECRAKNPGGLCAFGVVPDGTNCTFSYSVMGYLAIDDLVGITSLVNNATQKTFTNYTDFCEAKLVEFSATESATGFTDVVSNLTFWNNPSDVAANTNRTTSMIKMYNEYVSGGKLDTPMTALPEVTDLAKSNPPCFTNSKICADSQFGCRRKLYAQVCEVCTAASADCIVKEKAYIFPTLQKAPRVVPDSKLRSNTTDKGAKTIGGSKAGSKSGSKSKSASQVVVNVVVAFMASALYFS